MRQKKLDLKAVNIKTQFEEDLEIKNSLTAHNSKTKIIKWRSWNKLVRHVELLVKIKLN